MVQCWWCVAWAVRRAAAADAACCWTRNGVASLNATALEGKLAGVWLSATLLRRGDPALRTCLVTDAPAALARRALDATSARAGEAPGLIGLVVARGPSGAARRPHRRGWASAERPRPRGAERRPRALRAARRGSCPSSRRRSTRRSPSRRRGLCGAGVGAFLGALHASEDLRRVDVFLTKEKETHGDARARARAGRVAAQAGAMVARRTSGAFVGDWLDGFLKYRYHPGWHGDAIDPSTKHPDRVAGREFRRTSRRSTSSRGACAAPARAPGRSASCRRP
ncbi:hypothetical protein JL722_9344 [Aureococcus anophagefferens]|nr:hypothetical protein JL722_9344 [Aureococcus anophagefferens]